MLAKECPKAIPVLGLEPRVFRLEGGRAIQLRHTGKILSVERFELSHPEISRPKRDALDRSAKLTKNVVCKIRTYTSARPTRRKRCGQDSNLRGQSPKDFKSFALTTRPPQLYSLTS